MSNSPDNEKSQIEQNEDLKMKCKLKEVRIFNQESGKTETYPHPKQEQVDALAETDLPAAAALADQIRQTESLRRVKSSLESVRLRADGENRAKEKIAKEKAVEAERLQGRKDIGQAFEQINTALHETSFPDVEKFLDAVVVLTEKKKQLSGSDLNMYTSARDYLLSKQISVDANTLARFSVLDELNTEVEERLRAKQKEKEGHARIIDYNDPVAFAEAYGGDPVKAEVVRQRVLAKNAETDAKIAAANAPKPAVKPPSFADNVKSLFGFGKKKE